jgi:hypothetical protein
MNASHLRDSVDSILADPLAGCGRSGDGVAFVGPDVPVEVLLASGRPFGHLPWRADASTPWADRWLESSFPFWARSILEQWHQGDFDGLDTVVFSRADDASQRLYYYVAELRRRGKLRGPTPRIFDIALVPRESSLAHTAAAIVELMDVLAVSRPKLLEGIDHANRLRRRIAAIERNRNAAGPFFERLGRATLWSDATRWIDDTGRAVPDETAGRLRVLLAGSAPPDERLHEAVERAGASVVAEAHRLAPCRLGPELEAGSESVERSLARHLRRSSIAPRAFFDRASWIVGRARAVQAASVILWLTREDEALVWSVPAQQRALEEAGLATLVLPAASWRADGDTPERIAAFCERSVHASA